LKRMRVVDAAGVLLVQEIELALLVVLVAFGVECQAVCTGLNRRVVSSGI